jgi:hypothetical protein
VKPFFRSRRRAIAITAVCTAAAVVALTTVLVTGTGRDHRGVGAGRPLAAGSTPPTPGAGHPTIQRPGDGLTWHTPDTVAPPGTPIQEEYDQAFEQGIASQSELQSAAALTVPAPSLADGWPNLATADSPQQWAEEFTTGLLDVDFARQSRAGLEGWAQAQEAPLLLPGLPQPVQDKVLYLSLFDPRLLGGTPSPIPTSAEWSVLAEQQVRWSVSDLLIQVDPEWTQVVGSGWQPPDVRMEEEDVSGLLTAQQGGASTSHRFAVQIWVGSARWHDGYGTETVAGWES